VLSTGKLDFIITEGKKLGYKRYDDNNELIVFFNLEKEKAVFNLPSANYTDLLSNKMVTGKTVLLNPLTAVVLKKMK
jgi:beta-galactosidase GanA